MDYQNEVLPKCNEQQLCLHIAVFECVEGHWLSGGQELHIIIAVCDGLVYLK